MVIGRVIGNVMIDCTFNPSSESLISTHFIGNRNVMWFGVTKEKGMM